VPTSRLEAFSDGVFAIAATLLILNVSVAGGPLSPRLIEIWPSYVAYAVSFITIGIIWVNHHLVMSQIRQVNRLFLMLNVLFLMLIAFIPFPTRLLAENITRPDSAQAAARRLRRHLDPDRGAVQRTVALRRHRTSPPPLRRQRADGDGHRQELSSGSAALRRRDRRGVLQSVRKRGAVRGDRDLLRGGKLAFRGSYLR